MMDGYDMGSGAWTVMIIVWVVVIGLVIWLGVRFSAGRSDRTWPAPTERPREILDRRLATGEIDGDTYDRLRARLDGSPTSTT